MRIRETQAHATSRIGWVHAERNGEEAKKISLDSRSLETRRKVDSRLGNDVASVENW